MGKAASAQPKVAHTPPSYPVLYGKLGHLVQAYFPHMQIFILALVMSGCGKDVGLGLQSGEVLAIYGLDGRWAGQVVPNGQDCGPAATGLMSVGGSSFGFDPFQSTSVIRGTVSDAGQLSGTLSRSGGGGKDLSINFEGHAERDAAGSAIRGVLRSAACRWTVTLKRA